jgi:hypothetical protein
VAAKPRPSTILLIVRLRHASPQKRAPSILRTWAVWSLLPRLGFSVGRQGVGGHRAAAQLGLTDQHLITRLSKFNLRSCGLVPHLLRSDILRYRTSFRGRIDFRMPIASSALFDHLVGGGEQSWQHSEVKNLWLSLRSSWHLLDRLASMLTLWSKVRAEHQLKM